MQLLVHGRQQGTDAVLDLETGTLCEERHFVESPRYGKQLAKSSWRHRLWSSDLLVARVALKTPTLMSC